MVETQKKIAKVVELYRKKATNFLVENNDIHGLAGYNSHEYEMKIGIKILSLAINCSRI